MFLEFLRFEIRFWLRSWMLWIFTLVIGLLIFGAVSSDKITVGTSLTNTLRNAPFVIQQYYTLIGLLALQITTAFVNSSATRDFAHNTHQILFSTPLRKRDYLLGRFAGSALVSVIPVMGVSLGVLIARYMPWIEPERWGPIHWTGHLYGILIWALPNTLLVAAIIFAIAILTRSTVTSFLGSIVLLVGYVAAESFIEDLDNEKLAILLDPFGIRAFAVATKYWTVAERNSQALGLSGMVLWNRLLWLAVAAAVFALAYRMFQFSERTWRKPKKAIEEQAPLVHTPAAVAAATPGYGVAAQLAGAFRLELNTLVRSTVFVVILAFSLVNTIPNLLFNAEEGYGNRSLPVTYRMVEMIEGSLFMFIVAIITYFAGFLVWKERDARMDEIQDSLPHPTWISYASKFGALMVAVAMILFVVALAAVSIQGYKGYHRYQFGLYFTELFVMSYTQFFFLTVLAFATHILMPNKYLGYFAYLAFLIANFFAWNSANVGSLMVQYGMRPQMLYSDLFGYAPFAEAWTWFTGYWTLFACLLAVVGILYWQRGKETAMARRMAEARTRFRGSILSAAAALLVAFVGVGGWVFYNTKVLNVVLGSKDFERLSADFEKTYKKHQGLAQPRIASVRYDIDLYPETRRLTMKADQVIVNRTDAPISELHLTRSRRDFDVDLKVDGASIHFDDKRLGYQIWRFHPPIAPGESRHMRFVATPRLRGFAQSLQASEIVQNGTFFNNTVLPQIGYQADRELEDPNERRSHGLKEKDLMPVLERDCTANCRNTYLSNNSDWVSVETVFSTSPDQIAIAPGSLQREWNEGGRRYFHYKLDHDSANFYSFLSARYDVAREEWNGVKMEVYYHKDHTWNVPKMMRSIRKSLEYYTQNFGPYTHKQARIIEFPRVARFAQAFPGTMPYSEAIGFIAKIKDADDIDMVYYVVGHEMGHQWWAHQVLGANMQGATILSETLSQYSALMIMEREYGRDTMRKFLEYEADNYLRSRGAERLKERPLLSVESSQGYIHYRKGSLAMYYLKEMIGEDAVNRALRKLIERWAYTKPPYPTSYALVDALREVTPPELQYLIKDLFEDITLFSNRATEAKAVKRSDGKYDVTIEVESRKYKADAKGAETEVPVNDWMEVGAFAKPEKDRRYGKTLHRERVHIAGNKARFTFVTAELPEKAGIDPFHLLVDRVPDDNTKKIN